MGILTCAIFDVDATLVHAPPEYIHRVVTSTLADLGVESVPSASFANRFWYEGGRSDFLSSQGIDPAAFWGRFNHYDTPEARDACVTPYDDCHTIATLHEWQVPMGIVTAAPRNIAEVQVAKVGTDYFGQFVVARTCEGITPKPDPEGLLLCLKGLGIDPEQAAYVGDAAVDVEAAKAAGMYAVKVNRGEYEQPQCEADEEVESLTEILPKFSRTSRVFLQ